MKRYGLLMLAVVLAAVGAWYYAKSVRVPIDKPRNTPTPVAKNWFGAKFPEGARKTGELEAVQVYRGSPADRAGLKAKDVILAVDGVPTTLDEFKRELNIRAAGSKLTLTVRRPDGSAGGSELKLEVELVGSGGIEQVVTQAIVAGTAALTSLAHVDGTWPHYHDPKKSSVAVSALALLALAEVGKDGGEAGDQAWDRGLQSVLLSRSSQDNGLDDQLDPVPHRTYANAILALALVTREKQRAGQFGTDQLDYEPYRDWLVDAQVDERYGLSDLDWRFGGWPYYEGRSVATLRTDISVASWVLEALAATKLAENHVAWNRAARFLSRCQSLDLLSPKGTSSYTSEGPFRDGGFGFTPRSSKAGQVEVGADLLCYRTYGSASCDGVRGLIALSAGRPLEDRRVLAGLRWIARNYTLERNPGFLADDASGWNNAILFYYFAVLSRTLHAANVDVLKTNDVEHRWAEEMIRRVASLQRLDGSWSNPSGLMGEDSPTISTALSLLALAAARDRLLAKDGATIDGGAPLPPPPAPVPPPGADAVERGKGIFSPLRLNCDGCHKGGNAPPLEDVGDRYLERFGDRASAAGYLKKHIRDPKRYPGFSAKRWSTEMPGFSSLGEEELDDLVAYLLSRSQSWIEPPGGR